MRKAESFTAWDSFFWRKHFEGVLMKPTTKASKETLPVKSEDDFSWSRKAVVTQDIEITLQSNANIRNLYFGVNQKIRDVRFFGDAGYKEARLEWLMVICDSLNDGLPIPIDDFTHFIGMLRKMAGGEDPSKSFGLKKTKGNSKNYERLFKLREIAETVYSFNSNGYPMLDNSKGTESSYSKAATHHNVTESQAKAAWEIFGKTIKDFYENGKWEESLPTIESLNRAGKK